MMFVCLEMVVDRVQRVGARARETTEESARVRGRIRKESGKNQERIRK